MKQPPNPSGRTMLDGETTITDLEKTETNRDLVTAFAQSVLVERQHDLLESFVNADLIQHDPECGDGVAALRASLEALQTDGKPRFAHQRVHRVLAEGNFVLCMCEGYRDGRHSGLYDLFRVAEGKIAEQWNTVSPIAPRGEWKNDNGKF
jgi:predicted SnoaL-like aldol condensation-catalyzing enzyme